MTDQAKPLVLITDYADYQERCISTLSRGLTLYADFLHTVNGMQGEAGGEILQEFKKYFAYNLKHTPSLVDFDRKILAEELGDILWFCAVFRRLAADLAIRLSLDPLAGEEQSVKSLLQLEPTLRNTLDKDVLEYPPLKLPSLFHATYNTVSAINLLSVTLHHAFIDLGPVSLAQNQLCVAPIFDTDATPTDQNKYDAEVHLTRLLGSGMFLPQLFGNQPVGLLGAAMMIESLVLQLIDRIGQEYPGFTIERVWTANITKLQQKRYKKGKFDLNAALNRDVLDEEDVIRAVMGDCCAKLEG